MVVVTNFIVLKKRIVVSQEIKKEELDIVIVIVYGEALILRGGADVCLDIIWQVCGETRGGARDYIVLKNLNAVEWELAGSRMSILLYS